MKIINETSLSYRRIGEIIDKIIDYDKGQTHYFGKVECSEVEVLGIRVKVQIRYLKRYVEWRFREKC